MYQKCKKDIKRGNLTVHLFVSVVIICTINTSWMFIVHIYKLQNNEKILLIVHRSLGKYGYIINSGLKGYPRKFLQV